jgi:DNA-binding transcriptional ArsR family regulator
MALPGFTATIESDLLGFRKASQWLCIGQYIQYSRFMESSDAIGALAALAQPTRLEVFRLLVRHEPDGLPAGELARALGVPQNTMSAHLATLSRAGLIEGDRHSRSIIYRARLDGFRALTLFLLKDCCGGNAALCAPLIAELTPCCASQEACHVDL